MRTEFFMIFIGMGVVTFFTRFPFMASLKDGPLSRQLQKLASPIPIAILTSLIVPAIFAPKGHLQLSIANHYLIAGIVSVLIAYKTRNAICTIALGMAVIFVLRAVVAA